MSQTSRERKAIKGCLTPKEAVLLYNQGIALYNVISKDYAFKCAGRHYVSKNISRNTQHTFRKQIWIISPLTAQSDLIELLEKSKKVRLGQLNHNVGINGHYSKHIEGKKSLKNRIKIQFKKVKHFINNIIYNLR